VVCSLKANASEEGKLFGSVTIADIKASLHLNHPSYQLFLIKLLAWLTPIFYVCQCKESMLGI
jgi:hypothetical protein